MLHLFVCLFVPRVLLHRRERTWLEIRFRMHCALHCTHPDLFPSLTGRILPGFGCRRRANGGIFCAVLRSIRATAAGSCLLRCFSFVFHLTHCCMADIQSLQRKWSEKWLRLANTHAHVNKRWLGWTFGGECGGADWSQMRILLIILFVSLSSFSGKRTTVFYIFFTMRLVCCKSCKCFLCFTLYSVNS